MKRSSFTRLAPLVLALVLAARGASAQPAQPQPQPSQAPTDPLDNATMRWGPLGLNPALVLHDIGRDNNVFNEPTNPKSDFTFTFTPKLEVLLRPGPVHLTYTTSTDYVYYETYSSERGTNFFSGLKADFDFGPFHPYVSTGHNNTRDRLNREIDARARHQDTNYGTGVRVELVEGVFATASARYSQTAFDPAATFRGESLQTTMNQKTEGVDAGGGFALTPLTTFQVTVTREQTRFDFSPDRNSETWRVMPTVSFSPLAILQGTAALGYRQFTGHSVEVPDYSGFVATVTLGATVAEHHHIETTFSRDLQYGYDATASEYLETGLQVSWAWQITSPLDLKLSGGRSRLHYRSPSVNASSSDDTAHNYSASVGWRLRQNFKVAINADWRGRDSERSPDYAYDNRQIYANVTWGKQ
jgi:hypothetical protein